MRERKRTSAGLVALVAWAAVAWSAAPAQATIPGSLYTASDMPDIPGSGCAQKDAADGEVATDIERGYWFCDDGVPDFGGTTMNPMGLKGVTVPAKYGGDGYTGLPPANGIATDPGADGTGHNALDVDVSLPTTAPPVSGYPMVFMMHGCCSGNRRSWEARCTPVNPNPETTYCTQPGNTLEPSGERWHYNNAWFASRGYVVVTYTARGFVDAQNHGSTGQTQLDSRSFEINDFQSLACQVLTNEGNWGDINGQAGAFNINPNSVVTTGGSYGGGFAWMAATDPKWTCDADSGSNGTNMTLAASAPRYGWTDLAYTLVPNGLHSLEGATPAFDGCSSGPRDLDGNLCMGPGPTDSPIGTPKTSIVGVLFASGQGTAGDPNHTTFPPSILNSFTCLQGTYPLDGPLASPTCPATLSTTLPEFLRERSPYYQNDWFDDIDTDPTLRVPIYNAATLTDPLFPPVENRRMADRILGEFSAYPIKQYYGDYQHFVQNKAKEWGDLCGMDRHVCTVDDYPGVDPNQDLNMDPTNLVDPGGQAGRGVTTRLNKFIDNYALPSGGHGAVPANVTPDVTTSLQICPQNAADEGVAATDPGPRITEPTYGALALFELDIEMNGAQTTTSDVNPNAHATNSDPLGNFLFNGGRCPVETVIAEPGVASYTSEPLPDPAGPVDFFTMIGPTKVSVDFTLTGSTDGLQFNARLYDVLPNGTAVMIDRGTRRVIPTEATPPPGHVEFGLHGNSWRLRPGHRVRIEIAQDDSTFVKNTDAVPSSAALSAVELDIPNREADLNLTGAPDPKPPPANNPSTPAASTPAATTPTKCKKGQKLKKGKCVKKKKKRKK